MRHNYVMTNGLMFVAGTGCMLVALLFVFPMKPKMIIIIIIKIIIVIIISSSSSGSSSSSSSRSSRSRVEVVYSECASSLTHRERYK